MYLQGHHCHYLYLGIEHCSINFASGYGSAVTGSVSERVSVNAQKVMRGFSNSLVEIGSSQSLAGFLATL